MASRLREAAQTGNIDMLYELIQEDPYVLEKVDRVPFVDTPLHVAAIEGHTGFAMEMMNLKPSFARKLNPQGYIPLHLALNHQKTPLMRQLLKIDKELVRVKGKKGMTPFHLVATTGDTELVLEFLEACPECIQDLTVKGETALMLALRNEKMEAFEAMVRWLERSQHKDAHVWEESIVNHRDNQGHTVLYTAAIQDLTKAVVLLLRSHLPVDIDAVEVNKLEERPITNAAAHIQFMQELRGTKRNRESGWRSKYIGSKFSFWDRRTVVLGRAKNNVSMDLVNALLVIAALIITAAYQSSLSPPGSVWQGDSSSPTITGHAGSNFFTVGQHRAGSTVMNEILFIPYVAFNSVTIWTGIALIKRLFSNSLLLMLPLYLLGASFHLSMCVLSPNTWILRIQYLMLLFIIVILVSHDVPQVIKAIFQRQQAKQKWNATRQQDSNGPSQRLFGLIIPNVIKAYFLTATGKWKATRQQDSNEPSQRLSSVIFKEGFQEFKKMVCRIGMTYLPEFMKKKELKKIGELDKLGCKV